MSAVDPIGKQIGNYQVRTLLGSGGMGAVYLAFDMQLHRDVALKMMHAHISRSQKSSQRFLAEARSIARLSHPNIVVVHAFALEAGTPYLVMEYVSGGSLRDYLNERYAEAGKFLQIGEVLRLLRQVADALDYAHASGIVHRDVKPGNILLKTQTSSDGGADFRAVLSDFGLVKLVESTGFNTQGAIGTPRYMAPEQLEAGAVDGRTDLYALGIILYELVTGRPPFQPRNIREAWHMHAEQPPPLPRTLRPDIPNELAAVMMKAIAKPPDQRYQTGQEMSMALQHLEQTVFAMTELDSVVDATQLDTMGTYLQSRPASMPTAPVASVPGDLEHDRLAIHTAHNPKPHYVHLEQPSLTIGRESPAEIILNELGVSRRHATIVRQPDGSYTITDLGSTNGTLLDGVKLLAHVPEPLKPGQRVGLGPFTLELQTKTAPSVKNSLAALGFSAGQTSYMAIPAEALAAISFAPKDTTLDAGQSATLQVEIANNSQIVRHFRLETDLSPTWIPAPPEPVRLLPGERSVVSLTIAVPRAPSSIAGEYRFQVRSIDNDMNTVIGQGGGVLTVGPYSQVETDLHPTVVRGQGDLVMTVRNQGNTQMQATIVARDPEAALLFNPAQSVVTINPGEAKAVTLEVMPHPQLAVSTERRYPFEITVTPGQAEPQTQRGEMIAVPPPLPEKNRRWLLMAALGLLAIVAVLLGIVLFLSGDDGDGTSTSREPTIADTDGDSVLDDVDRCLEEAGSAENAGCPLQIAYVDGCGLFAPALTCSLNLLDVDSGDTRTLMNNVAPLPPVWSPDGSQIAVAVCSDPDDEDSCDLYAVNVAGESNVLADEPGLEVFPSWSPDGEQLVYMIGLERDYDIAVLELSGRRNELTLSDDWDGLPQWSPDGSYIVFGFGDESNIARMTPDGTDIRTLADDGANDFAWPAISPDSAYIAYISSDSDLYVMNNEGSNRRNLTRTETLDEWFPSWSPDSREIAYMGIDETANDGTNIYVSDFRLGNRRQLTTNNRSMLPIWSPDGTQIAFLVGSLESGDLDIYVMDSDGTDVRQMTGFSRAGFMAWRPVP